MIIQRRYVQGSRLEQQALLRLEGAKAYAKGKSIKKCPYLSVDAYHWIIGYQTAQRRALMEKVQRKSVGVTK